MKVNQPIKHLSTADALNIEESKEYKKHIDITKDRGKKIPESVRVRNFGAVENYNSNAVILKALYQSEYLPKLSDKETKNKAPKNKALDEELKVKEQNKRAFLPPGIFSF